MRLTIVLMLLASCCYAQNKKSWNGKQCAVVLTYDDALNVHLDNAIPLLDSLNFDATFYLSGYFPGSRNRLKDWTTAARNGHELANHTLFHPCAGNMPGRSWVKPDYDLSTYTMQRLLDEVRMTNTFLESLDGKKKRTFAYPCGDTKVGDESYIDQIKNDFVSARGVKSEMVQLNNVDLYNVPSYGINGETGEQLIALVKKAMSENALLVFLFHGVGGEHNLNVSLQAHRELLVYLKQHEKEIWVTPFKEATEYIRKNSHSK
ncbi:polysaccharide deacetylase family protein [Chryseolinea sp. H1M3-3]|uniref:polysaccharide deacetylase family protein n=1 Tax=Chryseolinea sp. H1M3-3 TaxID=3034144 RepID=UPI0023EDD3AC|nr:polysaccharide deacetylase family protein [Chryseolinea sp. H1M3-3]